jgi:hypothetical protein
MKKTNNIHLSGKFLPLAIEALEHFMHAHQAILDNPQSTDTGKNYGQIEINLYPLCQVFRNLLKKNTVAGFSF